MDLGCSHTINSDMLIIIFLKLIYINKLCSQDTNHKNYLLIFNLNKLILLINYQTN